ncbi:Plant self-incompatibility S1 [Macleaya cordata]|uniref:S-protein homolog n=1 Tax=Macleaya cordata TaxID=56857 RepID=A0A200R7A3_MACCD|nr:Plant self-incompatibility S1 [Macleaya cordata]
MAGGRGLKLPLSSMSLIVLVLALSSSSNWCPSAYGFWEIYFDRIQVWVYNELDTNTPLTIHCKSKDDDLGEHTLSFDQNWNWDFSINIWKTTLFWCNMWWHDSNGQLIQASHDAYSAKRDWRHYCRGNCIWSIRKDGWYYGDQYKQETLMFTWDKQIQ